MEIGGGWGEGGEVERGGGGGGEDANEEVVGMVEEVDEKGVEVGVAEG